jgi:hypothetical protein
MRAARKARAEIVSSISLLRRSRGYPSMNDQSRSLRRILAMIGLVFVALSIAMTFVVPGSFWNWGLLVIALVCVFLSRRAA